jgi:hypothetical protein
MAPMAARAQAQFLIEASAQPEQSWRAASIRRREVAVNAHYAFIMASTNSSVI